MKTKFQSFITENIDDDKRMGVYVSVGGVLNAIKFLKDRNIRFVLLFGSEEDDDEDYYLIIIEGYDYQKLPYDETEISNFKERFKDYYMPGDSIVNTGEYTEKVFLNWFSEEDIHNEWKIIPHETKNDLEEIEMVSNINKYNL